MPTDPCPCCSGNSCSSLRGSDRFLMGRWTWYPCPDTLRGGGHRVCAPAHRYYPQAVPARGRRAGRARSGPPESAFVRSIVMDAGSGSEQEPDGMSRRFGRRSRTGAGRGEARGRFDGIARAPGRSPSRSMRSADAESDPRITVIEESMSYADVLAWSASADAPHLAASPSEGPSVCIPMEAMSLGPLSRHPAGRATWTHDTWNLRDRRVRAHADPFVASRRTTARHRPRPVLDGADTGDAARGLRRLRDEPAPGSRCRPGACRYGSCPRGVPQAGMPAGARALRRRRLRRRHAA